MPWRLAPRAAYSVGLVGLVGLTGSIPFLRVPDDRSLSGPSTLPLRSLSCARVGSDAWSPLPGVEYTGALLIDLPAGPQASMAVILSDTIPLDLEARSASGMFPIRRERMASGPGVGVPPDLWLEGGTPWDLPGELVRVTLPARADRAETIALSLGRRAPRVLARLDGYAPAVKTRVCAATGFSDPRPAADEFQIDLADSRHFATGWDAEDVRLDGAMVRRMREHGAVLVPSSRDGVVTVRIRAAPPATPSGDEAPRLSLRVNDIHDAATQSLSPGSRDYEWEIPATAWVEGINELLFRVSRTPPIGDTDGRPRGLALERLSVSIAERVTER